MITILRWSILTIIGVLLGGYLSETDALNRAKYSIWPIVTMKGDVASQSDSEVVIRMAGTKHRGEECEFKQIHAFGERLAGPTVDLQISRIDMPSLGNTKPKGVYDIGFWRIWPTMDILVVRVNITHSCQGKLWSTEIANIRLKE